MIISLIGPSGAGKGTHIARLCAEFGFTHLATGDLFRHNLEHGTALGLLARKYMQQGDLVPDEVVDAMIEERVRGLAKDQGILFDGFPRTRYQARFLDELLESLGRRLDAVAYVKVPDEEIVRRLAGRWICRTCHAPYHQANRPPHTPEHCDRCGGQLYRRDDDVPEMVRVRLRVFHRVAGLVVDYYQETGRLVVIDGHRPSDTVYSALAATVEAVRREAAPTATRREAEQIRDLKRAVRALPPGAPVRPSLDVVFLGGPGSGKGTHAERLSHRLDIPHIATGDLFRENLKEQTDLGKLAKGYMERGELVPDDVTESMVEERLARPDTHGGFILDGFPRTVPQAEALHEMLTHTNRRLSGVVSLHVDDEEIMARLSGRLICRNCQASVHLRYSPPKHPGHCDACGGELYRRDDDNPETIRARLKTFYGQTAPLFSYYRQAGLLREVDGNGAVAEVAARVDAAISVLKEQVERVPSQTTQRSARWAESATRQPA
jgi:adenylate kinase